MATSSASRLPEEILERIIDLALPESASTIRCGHGAGGHQSLFVASKQTYRIARELYFRRPLKLYVTDLSYICEKSYSGYSWLQPIPWTSFTRIEIHLHPELSFLGLQHTDEEVTTSKGFGIFNNVKELANALKRSQARRWISNGSIDLIIRFHNACPFHDPISYADPTSLPAHHTPIWDYNAVDRIIAQFAWTNRQVKDVSTISQKFILPSMCWLAPIQLGDLSGTLLRKQFLPELMLSTYWGSSEMKEKASEDYRYLWTFDMDFCQCLRLWKQEFDVKHPFFDIYNVNANGQIHKAPMGNFRRYWWNVTHCQARLERYMRDYGESQLFAHELGVFREILSMITVVFPLDERFHAGIKNPKWQLMLASLRMGVLEPCLIVCLEEMSSVFTPDIPSSKSVAEAIQALGGYMGRLQALGLWNGRFEDLDTHDHHAVMCADLEQGIWTCRCGKQVRPNMGKWSNEVRQICRMGHVRPDTMY